MGAVWLVAMQRQSPTPKDEEPVITKKKKGASKSSDNKRTLSEIKNEMAKPRVTASARPPITSPKAPLVTEKSLPLGLKFFQVQETGVIVANSAILKEVERLKRMSRRLELLADEHSSVTKALLSVSGSILGIATVLKVLVISKVSTRSA
jgi:hypothetical protein